MFFSYPQWLGQAPDPSMTIPPQPTFRSTSRRNTNRQQSAPVAAEAEEINSSTYCTSSDTSNMSSRGLDDILDTNWEPEAEPISEMGSNAFPHNSCTTNHEEYLFSPESFAAGSTLWADSVLGNEGEESYFAPEHVHEEDAGQPPTYQESETYFYRFTDFYPYVYFSPLDYVRVDHRYFRHWGNDIYHNAFQAQDSQSKRATWSSPPYTSKENSDPISHSPKESVTPEATSKTPKLGSYSFTFLSQRESFPSVTPVNLGCESKKKPDTSTAKKTAKTKPITSFSIPFVYRKPLTLRDALLQYEEHWTILSDVDSSVRWSFRTIPWPQFPAPTSIEDINSRRIQRFLLASDINLKISLRKALLRFHPDKIPKLLASVEEKDKEQVSQGCITVAKCLNEIKGYL